MSTYRQLYVLLSTLLALTAQSAELASVVPVAIALGVISAGLQFIIELVGMVNARKDSARQSEENAPS